MLTTRIQVILLQIGLIHPHVLVNLMRLIIVALMGKS